MNYYPEPNIHIRDNVKVVLDFQHKIQHLKDKKIVLNTKISEVENKIPDYAKYITTQKFIIFVVHNSLSSHADN